VTDIPIDKGVPLPKGRREPKYPWASMEVGDSFFVPGTISTSAATAASKRLGFGFVRRSVVENGVAGIRFWRVS
jgi:hypothetical protein